MLLVGVKQPAVHGEKYTKPSSPHTGSYIDDVQLQPLKQVENRALVSGRSVVLERERERRSVCVCVCVCEGEGGS